MISGFRRGVRYSLFWDVTHSIPLVSHGRLGPTYLVSSSRVEQSKNSNLGDGTDR